MKKQILSLAAGAALVLATQSSFAAPPPLAAGSLIYQVMLNGGCTVSTSLGAGTVKDLNGGTAIDPLYSATPMVGKDAGSITVNCTNTTSYGVCLNAGSNAVGGNRYLKRLTGTETLAYTLKSAGTAVGDKGCAAIIAAGGTGGSYTDTTNDNAITGTGTGVDAPYSLTADVTIPDTSTPGTYQDTVTAMVVW